MQTILLGERYVYKFVCDPDALFQMALAENHRTALKMEATCIAAATASNPGDSPNAGEYPPPPPPPHHGLSSESGNRCRHQYR